MIGRDYYNWGSKRSISHRFGDNRGNPYPGPISVSFFEPHPKLILWNRLGSIYIQNLLGSIDAYIHPESSRNKMEKGIEAHDDLLDDDDWQSKFLSSAQVDSDSRSRHFYLDMTPIAVCLLPQSEILAVADAKAKIKLIDLGAMSIEHSFGNLGVDPGSMSSISSITAAKVGSEYIILIGDSNTQRVSAFTSRGRFIACLGEKGPMPGQFRDIVSLSAYIDRSHYSQRTLGEDGDLFSHSYLPTWYCGQLSMENLENILYTEDLSSNFVIGRREQDAKILDLLLLTPAKRIQRLLIKQEVVEGRGAQLEGGFYVANRAGDYQVFPSLFDLIRKERGLHFREEVRDSLILAAVDRQNFRVQILRLFWTQSFLFSPSMDVVMVLGGVKNRQVTLRDPVCAQFSATCELAVIDMGTQSILLLSPHFDLIKVVSLPYVSPREALRLGRKRDKFALTASERESSKRPCWLAFNAAGQMAASYQSGGVLVFDSCKSGSVGHLIQLEARALEKVICDYLTYPDAQALRNTCQYMHNFTRDLRYAYKLFPPPRRALLPQVLGFFLQFSRQGTDGENFLRSLELVDLHRNRICPMYIKGACHLRRCAYSHASVVYDRTDLQTSQAYLLLEDIETCINALYGPRLFYKYEVYFRELFAAYAQQTAIRAKRDPMSRRNETVRPFEAQTVRAVHYVQFLEVMLAIEEHVSGVKDITQHKLFAGQGRQRFVPKVCTSWQTLDDPRAYIDPLAQYERPLSVPPIARMHGTRMVTKKGFAKNEHVRGPPSHRYESQQASGVTEHVDQVAVHAARAKALVERLFS